MPVWLRVPVGLVSLAVGALALWLGTGFSGEPSAGNSPGAIWVGGAFGVCMIAMGLTLVIGVAAGVGDYGERPHSMRGVTRLMIDALGYVWGVAMTAMFGFFAFSRDAGWGDGASGVIGRLVFGFFTLLLGGATLFALATAISRAVRGLPYDDQAPKAREDQ